MIEILEHPQRFHLSTEHSSYVMQVLDSGHLAHVYYGPRLSGGYEQLSAQLPGLDASKPPFGNSTLYAPQTAKLDLNRLPQEFPGHGKGDYRPPAAIVRRENGDATGDWLFAGYRIEEGCAPPTTMPGACCGPEQAATPASDEQGMHSLVILLRDDLSLLEVELYYTSFPDADVITRRAVLTNAGATAMSIEGLNSFSLDMMRPPTRMLSLNGAWVRERRPSLQTIAPGTSIVESLNGFSSSKHSPFIALSDADSSEQAGNCWGFGLVYSGGHRLSVHRDEYDGLRVQGGFPSPGFSWLLEGGQSFETFQSCMTYSSRGFSGMSQNLHHFVRRHIVRGYWLDRERPVLINNWEATYFDFNEAKLLRLAREAASLGIELFVLDDGWFGKRNDENSSLGDWTVNPKKLPRGLAHLGKKIRAMGMMFGLWLEPEMISEDSQLFRSHPEYRVQVPGRVPSVGRNQYLLDLANPEVQDMLLSTLSDLLENNPIDYIKWDMNRNFADMFSPTLPARRQGEFGHRYMMGLYALLKKLTSAFPKVLFESCASGGGRFDLGMLCYMPQTWTSDDTDAWERVGIQGGTSFFAPTSTMGAHVSASPNHQTLRQSSLESRFNTAAFGLLGYELDLTKLSPMEKKVVSRQIAFYKQQRRLFQFGRLHRILDAEGIASNPSESQRRRGVTVWLLESEDRQSYALGYFQRNAMPNPPAEWIALPMIAQTGEGTFRIEGRTQYRNIRDFGELINRALPVDIHVGGAVHGIIADRYLYEEERYLVEELPAELLAYPGFHPPQQFYATGEHPDIAIMGDVSSRIYLISKERQA